MRKLRGEYVLLGVLVLMAAVAFPAVKNVYLFQSLFLAVCGGLGFR